MSARGTIRAGGAYADESHFQRYLLKCRECGQLYFFEFLEEIDWSHGKDLHAHPRQFERSGPRRSQTSHPKRSSRCHHGSASTFPKKPRARTVYWIREAEITAGSGRGQRTAKE